jgi:hypothetical protein
MAAASNVTKAFDNFTARIATTRNQLKRHDYHEKNKKEVFPSNLYCCDYKAAKM